MAKFERPWGPEEELRLAQLWVQDTPSLSTREIGRAMGRNKNQVIGKARRMGLPLKKKPTRKQKPSGRGVVLILSKLPKVRKPKVRVPPIPLAPPEPPIPGGLHIMDLKDHHCRGIIGHGADGLARYCGAHVAVRPVRYRGSLIYDANGGLAMRPLSWCEGHAAEYLRSD